MDESDVNEFSEVPRVRARHRGRLTLGSVAGRRGPRRVFTRPPSRAGWWLLAALAVSLLVAIASIAILPEKWRAASAGATPGAGPTAGEATGGTVKRGSRAEGLGGREPGPEIRGPS